MIQPHIAPRELPPPRNLAQTVFAKPYIKSALRHVMLRAKNHKVGLDN